MVSGYIVFHIISIVFAVITDVELASEVSRPTSIYLSFLTTHREYHFRGIECATEVLCESHQSIRISLDLYTYRKLCLKVLKATL